MVGLLTVKEPRGRRIKIPGLGVSLARENHKRNGSCPPVWVECAQLN